LPRYRPMPVRGHAGRRAAIWLARPFAEEPDHALLGALRRAVGIVVAQMNRQHGVRRCPRVAPGLRGVDLDGLEAIAEGALVGVEARVGDGTVAEEAQPDHREIFRVEAPLRARDLVR